MEQNRFFRWVWRFNALILALGGIFLVVMAAWSLFAPRWGEEPSGHFTPVPKSAEQDHTYRLSRLSLAIGREALFQLGRWEGAPQTYGLATMKVSSENARYNGPDTVNLLAVDERSGAGHWLFHGYGREIVSEEAITMKLTPEIAAVFSPNAAPANGEVTIALAIRTIDADTDKDGALTAKDRQSFYVYRAGTGFATKLTAVDYVISSEQADDTHYLLVYERGDTAIAATYSLPDFKLISEKKLPGVPD